MTSQLKSTVGCKEKRTVRFDTHLSSTKEIESMGSHINKQSTGKYKKWPYWLMPCLFQLRVRPIQTQSHEDGTSKGQSKASWNSNCLADLQSLWQIAISQCQLTTGALWLINCSRNDQENYSQASSFSPQCLRCMKSSFFLVFNKLIRKAVT